MLNPKQNLTSFSRVYQAKSALLQPALGAGVAELAFGGVAVEFAKQNTVHETDAAALSNLQQTQSISTIEELVALARLDETQKTHFIKDLGLPSDLPTRLIDQLRKVSPEILVEIERFEKFEYALGCDLDFNSPPPTINPFQPAAVGGVVFGAPPPAGQPPPTVFNLIDGNMPPIRDQADRGTCAAFASIVCLEYHLNRFGNQTALDLSEQFQYWNIVTTTGHRNLESAYPLLASAGSCREITWQYYGKVMPGNDSQAPPPASATAEAMAYRCHQVRQIIPPREISAIQAVLRRGRIVAIAIPVYDSWYNSGTVRQYGNITVPTAKEDPASEGHAIALVGYADDPDYAGGGYFIVRNSWDSRWGTKSVFGPGYGTIPYRYISNHNWDAWCIIS
jgi:C1A family cysteine protease